MQTRRIVELLVGFLTMYAIFHHGALWKEGEHDPFCAHYPTKYRKIMHQLSQIVNTDGDVVR